MLLEVGLEQRLDVEPGLVLRGDQDRLEPDRAAVLVLECDLGLPVGTEIRQHAGLAHLGQTFGEAVGEPDRHRHEIGRLVACVAEHHSLVAGALGVDDVLAALARAHLESRVDTLGDVGRLLVDRDDDAARVAVEAVRLAVVTDLAHVLTDDLRDVDVRRRRYLTGHDDESGREQGLACDAASRVLVEDRVEDASEIWSAILSGWPSVTDSEVNV